MKLLFVNGCISQRGEESSTRVGGITPRRVPPARGGGSPPPPHPVTSIMDEFGTRRE